MLRNRFSIARDVPHTPLLRDRVGRIGWKIAAVALACLMATAKPAIGGGCYSYLVDVNGNGNYQWNGGRWYTEADAKKEADIACKVGSKVKAIGNMCTGQTWSYGCGSTATKVMYSLWYFACGSATQWALIGTSDQNAVQQAKTAYERQYPNYRFTMLLQGQSPSGNPCPVTNIQACFFQYYNRNSRTWVTYRGQIANSRPLATCSDAANQRWYNEVVSVAQQVNGVKLTTANRGDYVSVKCQTVPSNLYYCSNGFLFQR
jgi:hypothetical protein